MFAGTDRAARLRALVAVFRARFDAGPTLGARAPGRVNLIGEHTDYNDGLVLPVAIDRDAWVVGAPRPDPVVRCHSVDLDETHVLDLSDDGPPGDDDGFAAYVRAVVLAVRERGVAVRGLDVAIESRVPLGAGLSSSAALTVSLARLLFDAAGAPGDPVALAETAHRAESHFMGIGSGILDQFASALGAPGEALRIDCRTREVARVPLPAGEFEILIADSGVRRRLAAADSGYRQRVAECAAALAAARDAGLVGEGATRLRDLAAADLPALARVADPVPFRRARHVVTENARVDACCAALAAGDLARVGALVRASHASLRDDYAVSTDELDALCAAADALPGVHGSRLVGAGFGGCTLHLVERGAGGDVAAAVGAGFERRFGRRPPIFTLESGEGASALALALR